MSPVCSPMLSVVNTSEMMSVVNFMDLLPSLVNVELSFCFSLDTSV